MRGIYSRSLNGSLSTGKVIGLALIMRRAVEDFSSDWFIELPTGAEGMQNTKSSAVIVHISLQD